MLILASLSRVLPACHVNVHLPLTSSHQLSDILTRILFEGITMETDCHTLNFVCDENLGEGEVRRASLPHFGRMRSKASGPFTYIQSRHFVNSDRKARAENMRMSLGGSSELELAKVKPENQQKLQQKMRPFAYNTHKNQSGTSTRRKYASGGTTSGAHKSTFKEEGDSSEVEAKRKSDIKNKRLFVVCNPKGGVTNDVYASKAKTSATKNLTDTHKSSTSMGPPAEKKRVKDGPPVEKKQVKNATHAEKKQAKDGPPAEKKLFKDRPPAEKKQLKDGPPAEKKQVKEGPEVRAGAGQKRAKDMSEATKMVYKKARKPSGGNWKSTVLPESLLTKVTDFIRDKPDRSLTADDWTQDTNLIDTSLGVVDEKAQSMQGRKNKNRWKKARSKQRQVERSVDSAEPEVTKSPRQRPNYFLAIQVTNPLIHAKLHVIQQHILHEAPLLTSAMVSLPKLHFTLMVLRLDDQEAVEKAIVAMDDCKSSLTDFTSDPLTLTIAKLGDFRGNVIFSKVEEGPSLERLSTLAEVVSNCFAEHGLTSTEQRPLTPHLTILKMSQAHFKVKREVKRVKPALYAAYKEDMLGHQTALSIQLCAMLKPKDQLGYYHVEHEIPLVDDHFTEPSAPEEFPFSDTSPSPISTVSRVLVTAALKAARDKLLIECNKELLNAEREQVQHSVVEFENYLVWEFVAGFY